MLVMKEDFVRDEVKWHVKVRVVMSWVTLD